MTASGHFEFKEIFRPLRSIEEDAEALLSKIGGVDTGNISDVDAGLGFSRLLNLEGCRRDAIEIISHLLCGVQSGGFLVVELTCVQINSDLRFSVLSQ